MLNLKNIALLFLGLLFTGMSVFFLTGMDDFENYVYNLGLFSFDISLTVARLFVSLQLAIAFLLLLDLFFRVRDHFRNRIYSGTPYSWKSGMVVSIMAIIIPVVISPPDYLKRSEYRKAVAFDEGALYNKLPAEMSSGKHLLCFYSVKCRFCNMMAQRVATVSRKMKLGSEDVYCIFWKDNPAAIEAFYDQNHSPEWLYTEVDPGVFLDLTEGSFPLLLFVQNGKVIDKMDYRSFDEEKLYAFMQFPD